MKVLDPGHAYELNWLDGPNGGSTFLFFVKREGALYPGNKGAYPGTTIQEVLRAIIDRIKYVNNQIPDQGNQVVLSCARTMITELELRAARRHNRTLANLPVEIEKVPVCPECGHIGCEGNHNANKM